MISSVELGLTHALLDSVQVSISGLYRRQHRVVVVSDDDSSDVEADKKDDILYGALTARYRPAADFLELFVRATSAVQDSNLENADYDRTIVSAGVRLEY